MYKLCTTEKSEQQQQQFKNCLLAAMEHTPYRDISVTHLCKKTGLPRNTFYRLFESKEDVLYALIDHTMMNHIDHMVIDVNSSMELLSALRQLYENWLQQTLLLEAIIKNGFTHLLVERVLAHTIREPMDIFHAVRVVDPDVEQEYLTFMIHGTMGLIIDWHRSGYKKSPAQMAEITHRLFTNPSFHFLND